MSDVSVKLRECIEAMNATFSSKQENIKKEKDALALLRQELESVNKKIATKEEKIANAETEIEALDTILTQTQSRYDEIIKSSQELMDMVESYAPDN
tara:strand:- start:776 stop:1066 length:291 start_codon:yes stop_codon:yes gene_type:complete